MPVQQHDSTTPVDAEPGYTAALADLCDGDRFAKGDPDGRDKFPISAMEYTASPIRDIALVGMPLPKKKYLSWLDTGEFIAAVFDPSKISRRTALAIVGVQSGKTLVDLGSGVAK